jgi:hypothetical protein
LKQLKEVSENSSLSNKYDWCHTTQKLLACWQRSCIISDALNAADSKLKIIWMGCAQRSINKRPETSTLKISFIQDFWLCLLTFGNDQKAILMKAYPF